MSTRGRAIRVGDAVVFVGPDLMAWPQGRERGLPYTVADLTDDPVAWFAAQGVLDEAAEADVRERLAEPGNELPWPVLEVPPGNSYPLPLRAAVPPSRLRVVGRSGLDLGPGSGAN